MTPRVGRATRLVLAWLLGWVGLGAYSVVEPLARHYGPTVASFAGW